MLSESEYRAKLENILLDITLELDKVKKHIDYREINPLRDPLGDIFRRLEDLHYSKWESQNPAPDSKNGDESQKLPGFRVVG